MTSSTSTMLQVVNKVLLNVGERQVTAFTSPTALKALNAVEEALREIENLDDWSWTRSEVTASSWSNEVATLPTFQRIHQVTYQVDTNSRREVSFIDKQSFNLTSLRAFNSTQDVGSYYTIIDDNTIALNPYPTDATTRGNFKFLVSLPLVIGLLPASVLPVPERLILMVVKLASYLMAVRHLDDTNIAKNFRSEFEAVLSMVRSRETLLPTRGTNMFKRRGTTRYI
jgi:hypothetical protein